MKSFGYQYRGIISKDDYYNNTSSYTLFQQTTDKGNRKNAMKKNEEEKINQLGAGGCYGADGLFDVGFRRSRFGEQ